MSLAPVATGTLGPRRTDTQTAMRLAAHFAFVFAPVWLAAWAGPGWLTIACWLWVGLLAHGFHLAMHELIHKLLFRNVRWNEWLAHRVVAPLFLVDFDAFRRRHWAHHRRLGTAEDPKYTYRIDPGGSRLFTLALSMLTVVGAVRKFSLQVGGRSEGSAATRRRALAAAAVVQPLWCASVVAAARVGHPNSWIDTLWSAAVAYGVVYLYGLASITVWMTTLRGIAEHRRAGAADVVEGDAALRNFTHGPLEWLLFGAYGFADHATHHRHPAVPCHQLPALSRVLARDDATLRPVGTHIRVLARLARRREVDVAIGGQSMGTSTRPPSTSEATR